MQRFQSLTCGSLLAVAILWSAVACPAWSAAAWAQEGQKSEARLAQLTEDVQMYSQLVRRGGDQALRPHWERSLAWSLCLRGELFVLTLKRAADGLQDLDDAAARYRRLENVQGDVLDEPPTLARVLFVRGLALRDLGRHEEAVPSITEAIKLYEKCVANKNKSMEYLEHNLAWFYQSRGEILSRQEAAANDAINDFDRAIAIHTFWCA